ncbi:holo-[acyl-carrier protein] synthase [Kitasatospora sp. MAA4]|uniref:holo-ACP synthase n=1 Tax=Kitasatospora sp. MAA4 TaxID=3035093 RepID=UPI00247517F7|nr:holo-ACP synthase [Kitasatospora sp. MAA4]MDH6134299.1 holo-[acyl-carrier protein] synthase [Kitasatospora sp. MAA4]
MPSGRVGIDLVPFERVRQLTADAGEPVLRRMLSEAETALCRRATGWDIAGVAGRLAAKEAVFKTLRTRGQPLPWLGIEILKDDGGAPFVRFSGRAAQLARDAGIEQVDVSITHDEPYAVAVAFGTTGATAQQVEE